MTNKDYHGREITTKEHDDDVITVWELTCLHTDAYDVVVIRGWQDMLAYVQNHLDTYLERFTDEELKDEGRNIQISLTTTTVGEYRMCVETVL